MSYPTRRDYSWLIDKVGAPDSPLPLQQDAKDFSLPREIDDKISPVFDAYGWERYATATALNFTGVNVASVQSSLVPAGRLRYIFDVSGRQTDNALAVHFWFEHRVTASGLDIGLGVPFLAPSGTALMQVSPGRSVVLAPFDAILVRTSAAVGVGETLTLRFRFIDIPIGEYIPPR